MINFLFKWTQLFCIFIFKTTWKSNLKNNKKKYLEIYFKNLEKSWKYHGISSVRKSGNPVHRNATDSAEPGVLSTQQIVFVTKPYKRSVTSEVVQVATATFMMRYRRCNILIRPHFPVHISSVHKYNIHLCTPLQPTRIQEWGKCVGTLCKWKCYIGTAFQKFRLHEYFVMFLMCGALIKTHGEQFSPSNDLVKVKGHRNIFTVCIIAKLLSLTQWYNCRGTPPCRCNLLRRSCTSADDWRRCHSSALLGP